MTRPAPGISMPLSVNCSSSGLAPRSSARAHLETSFSSATSKTSVIRTMMGSMDLARIREAKRRGQRLDQRPGEEK